MKFQRIYILLIIFLLFQLYFVSCIQEESAECITAVDCPDGFLCIDGFCNPPESSTDNSNKDDSSEVPDNAVPDNGLTGNDSNIVPDDSEKNDGSPDSNFVPDDDGSETPDEGPVCTEDTCSGFGTCEMVDGKPKCTCDEFHKGDDCSECVPGYHMEVLDDDENGDGKFSCVKNVACTPDPCNGGQCTDKDMTVTCKCTTGYTGRWCTDCDTGYLKSIVDQKCKPDCDHGTYNCTGTKVCGVDPVKNEAGCVCKEYFSGTDCLSCDAAHFCSSHGTCAASGETAVCTCNEAWAGNADCSTCGQGYLQDGANCVEGCTDYCGATIGSSYDIGGTSYLVTATSYGSCQLSGGNATCVCSDHWKTESTFVLPIPLPIIKPACSDCDTANPPVGGCPE
ncbi:hypothetical protein KA996_06205 [bacterium]|jgi:hypothetical protein|nr:hypothetical protein [bacterium]